jgi:hypothetical protein
METVPTPLAFLKKIMKIEGSVAIITGGASGKPGSCSRYYALSHILPLYRRNGKGFG